MKLSILTSAIVAAPCLLGGTADSSPPTRNLAEEEKEGAGISTCKNAGSVWAGCAGYGTDLKGTLVTNATDWWYEKIYPYIPKDELQYYQEPFGGATQPSLYRPDLVKSVLRQVNEFQGITYSHLLGGRDVGARTPIHRHDFSATTHVLSGYVTVFLEKSPPKTYGPGESYYMPPGGLTMTSTVMPRPIYNGSQVEQKEFSTNLDANASPTGTSVTTFVEVEMLPGGGTFDWRSGRYERCEEYPRYACSIPSIGENPQDASTKEEDSSTPKDNSHDESDTSQEKSENIPMEEDETSQNSPGSVRARSLLADGAFFLPIMVVMVSSR